MDELGDAEHAYDVAEQLLGTLEAVLHSDGGGAADLYEEFEVTDAGELREQVDCFDFDAATPLCVKCGEPVESGNISRYEPPPTCWPCQGAAGL